MFVLEAIGVFCVILFAVVFIYEGLESFKESNESSNW
jgi:hypothetical protein